MQMIKVVCYELSSLEWCGYLVCLLILEIEQTSGIVLIARDPCEVEAVVECRNNLEVGLWRFLSAN